MRRAAILLAISMVSLSACEKAFDEKYQDNLEKLNQEARDIESGVDQRLAAGREADKIIESAEDVALPSERKSEAAQ